MEPDPKKPSIKINRINIPDIFREKSNTGQTPGKTLIKAPGQGAYARSGANIGQLRLAGATSLSTMDPFIKVVADSNKGIILMPVLSDVTLSMPSSSLKFMSPESSSPPPPPPVLLDKNDSPRVLQDRNTQRVVSSNQYDINTSKTPYVSTGPPRS